MGNKKWLHFGADLEYNAEFLPLWTVVQILNKIFHFDADLGDNLDLGIFNEIFIAAG